MSLAQRLAWLDGVSTLAVLATAIAVWSPVTDDPVGSLWRLAARVGIVGGGRLAAELAEQIATRPDLAMRVAGVLTPEGDAVAGVQRLGAYGDVPDVMLRARPDRIIVAMPDRRGNLPVSALLSCRFRGVRVEEGTEAYERFTRRLAVESLTPSGLIFGDGFRVSRAQLALKRGMSVVIASIALVAMAP